MKSILLIIQMIGITMLISCDKDAKADVENFIQQVKENSYTSDSLPEFSPEVIPVLLKEADNYKVISHFPINPYSTYGPVKQTVCECFLWTIEHIRLDFGSYNEPGHSFPSFVGELTDKTDINVNYLETNQLKEAYNLYYHWWYDNEGKDFETFRHINPLEGSNYVWK